MNTAQVSRDLGVNENSLYKLKREYVSDQKNAFPGKGRMKPEEEELRELREQLKRLEMERDILKKPSDTSLWFLNDVYVHRRAQEIIRIKIAL